jgi:hypothetical protein
MTKSYAVAEAPVSQEPIVDAISQPNVRETLADIFADSRREPEQYLEETISPLGGE